MADFVNRILRRPSQLNSDVVKKKNEIQNRVII